jgi:hypothetical protein
MLRHCRMALATESPSAMPSVSGAPSGMPSSDIISA